MKKKIITLALFAGLFVSFTSCKSDDDGGHSVNNVNTEKVTEKQVLENYADMVLQNYTDAYNDAVRLQTAVNNFIENPSEATQNLAKDAWLASRESYGPSEAYRFADGPIDFDDVTPNWTEKETYLNSWPLDENYIDYTRNPQNPSETLESGIINDINKYPEITEELLDKLNQDGSEENVSTGYHAVEFLLWGQDVTKPSEGKPGLRTYKDYIEGANPVAKNVERRKTYLKYTADLIVKDLKALVDQWKVGGAYRTKFLANDTKEALKDMLTGPVTLAKSELSGERMYTALESQSQEDEHSCFSDNTHVDIRRNFDGIVNVYEGSYGTIKGASIADLVKQKNPELAKKVQDALNDTKNKVYATGIPFDIAISGGESSPAGQKILAAVQALRNLGDQLTLAGSELGLKVTVEEE